MVSPKAAVIIEQVFESLPQAYVSGMINAEQYERASEAATAKLDRHLNQSQCRKLRDGIVWALSGEANEPAWFV